MRIRTDSPRRRARMSDQNAQEPTMEEILASIRRIISEDDAPAEEPPRPIRTTPPRRLSRSPNPKRLSRPSPARAAAAPVWPRPKRKRTTSSN
jgi:cell pole-organizing protein PopZ